MPPKRSTAASKAKASKRKAPAAATKAAKPAPAAKKRAPPKKAAGPAAKRAKTAAAVAAACSDGPVAGGEGEGAASAAAASPEAMFAQFADTEERGGEAMTLEGIERLCGEVGLDAGADVRALVLLWRLGAKERPGELQRHEFLQGMAQLQCRSAAELRRLAGDATGGESALDPTCLNETAFRDFYRFCFAFHLEGTFKTLEREVVADLLPLVLGGEDGGETGGGADAEGMEEGGARGRPARRTTCRSPFLADFLAFLPHCDVNRISADQWNGFLDFSTRVSPAPQQQQEGGSGGGGGGGDGAIFQGFDPDAAWPVLLDDFVEWCQKGKNQPAASS